MTLKFRRRIALVRTEDALRKIKLLRQVRVENGALPTEAENALRLVEALMVRHAIKPEDVSAASPRPTSRMTWIYWQELLNEFGLQLSRFGRRGNAAIGNDKVIYIKLGTAQWWIEQRSGDERQTSVRDWGVESLRNYLNQHARRYSLLRREA
jgi:hypothetical protein